VNAAVAGAVLAALLAGQAQAACKPEQLDGRWSLYAAPAVECRLRVSAGAVAGRCREDGYPFRVGGELSLSRSCDLDGHLAELPRSHGGFLGLLEGALQGDVGAGIMRRDAGDIAGLPGAPFTLLRRAGR